MPLITPKKRRSTSAILQKHVLKYLKKIMQRRIDGINIIHSQEERLMVRGVAQSGRVLRSGRRGRSSNPLTPTKSKTKI